MRVGFQTNANMLSSHAYAAYEKTFENPKFVGGKKDIS